MSVGGLDAAAAWGMVLRADPQGAHAATAHLQLAENAFAAAELDRAREHYGAVLASGSVPLADYAHYKLAWTLYNLQEAPAAIAHLLALRHVEQPALWRDARRDIVRFSSNLPLSEALRAVAQACEDDTACRTDLHERLRSVSVGQRQCA